MILPPPCFTMSSQHCFTPYTVQCMLLIKVNLCLIFPDKIYLVKLSNIQALSCKFEMCCNVFLSHSHSYSVICGRILLTALYHVV